MLYQADITIPASTTKESPKTETLRISKGIITKFMVRPRPGHQGLAHLVIKYHEGQIAPSTEGMDIHGDKDPIDWEDEIRVQSRPYSLKLVGWNDDDTYQHTFSVYVVVLPQSSLLTYALATMFRNLIASMFGRKVSAIGEEE